MEVETIFSSAPRTFQFHDRDRSSFARYFASIIETDPRLSGKVLDVGSGEFGTTMTDIDGHDIFAPVFARCAQLDGLDPSDVVLRNNRIVQKYHSTLEAAPLPEAWYDALVSTFVLEHVATPRDFFAAACRTLRPGGVFYSVTPHAHHPFALCTSLIEFLGIKRGFARATEHETINTYQTHNRLNTRAAVVRACDGLPFSKVSIFFAPCVQWDTYFPRPLRAIPHAYDRLLGVKFGSCFQQMMVKLERST